MQGFPKDFLFDIFVNNMWFIKQLDKIHKIPETFKFILLMITDSILNSEP